MSAAPAKKAKTTTSRPSTDKPKKATMRPAAKAPPPAATAGPVEVCPRCGTTTFGPEERTRWEGRRTVRFTVLVCERGHTFAHPVPRPA